jgi:hypothetical protein
MRERGFSSWLSSGVSRVSAEVVSGGGVADSLPVTVISLPPSWVWLRRRAVRAAVSFSKVTVADLVLPSVVMSMVEILPLRGVSGWVLQRGKGAHQKLKKSLISLSSVWAPMFLT